MTAPPPPAPRRLPGPDDFPATGANALATFGQRAVARIVDTVLVSVPALLLFMLVYGDEIVKASDAGDGSAFTTPLWITAVGLALDVVYETVLIAWTGKTVGKLLMGVRVARYADGRTPTVSQSALRCLLPTSVAAAAAVISADAFAPLFYLSVFLNPLLRGWHDLAGGTIVIRTR